MMQFLTNRDKIQEAQCVNYKLRINMSTKKTSVAFLIFANRVIQDAISGKWSYIDVFDEIVIPASLDYFYQSFNIGGRLNNVPAGETKMELRLIDPNDLVFATQVLTGTLQKGDVGLTAAFNLLKFVLPGIYTLQIFFNGAELPTSNKYHIKVSKES
jgi:hypothetical protein